MPWVLLGVAAAGSFVFLVAMDSHLTFIADDWMLLVKRQGFGASYLFKPFHGNIVVGPALLYKVMREIFGMSSATPYYVVAIGTFIGSAVLLFVYLRGRVGDWLALAAAVLVLFLGAAFEDLLFAFQIGYFASVAAGLGMLVEIDREEEAGDKNACALLIVSLAFSSVGLAFAVGAIVDLLMGRSPKRRRLFVVLIPLGLFALWWLAWGHTAANHVSADNLLGMPKFVFKAAAGGITSLLGLATGDGSEPSQPHLIWGKLILLGGLVALAVKIWRERGTSRGLAVALAIGLSFWVAAAINRDVTRLPTSSRFQYPSAIALLLIAGEMLRGVRVPRVAVVAAAVVTALAVSGGVSLIHREYTERWRPYADTLRASLAAVELAEPDIDPHYQVIFPPDIEASARAYFAAVDPYGSPALSATSLAVAPQGDRERADLVMAQSQDMALVEPPPGQQDVKCQTIEASVEGQTGITLLRGGFSFRNDSGAAVEIRLGRYAEGFPVHFGTLPAGAETTLQIPKDDSEQPWSLGVSGTGPVRLCATG